MSCITGDSFGYTSGTWDSLPRFMPSLSHWGSGLTSRHGRSLEDSRIPLVFSRHGHRRITGKVAAAGPLRGPLPRAVVGADVEFGPCGSRGNAAPLFVSTQVEARRSATPRR